MHSLFALHNSPPAPPPTDPATITAPATLRRLSRKARAGARGDPPPIVAEKYYDLAMDTLMERLEKAAETDEDMRMNLCIEVGHLFKAAYVRHGVDHADEEDCAYMGMLLKAGLQSTQPGFIVSVYRAPHHAVMLFVSWKEKEEEQEK
jgi:hypothetical protein